MQQGHEASTSASGSPTSPYRGVSWNVSAKKWQAKMQISGKWVMLGYYASQEEAAAASDAGAYIAKGPGKAKLSFPEHYAHLTRGEGEALAATILGLDRTQRLREAMDMSQHGSNAQVKPKHRRPKRSVERSASESDEHTHSTPQVKREPHTQQPHTQKPHKRPRKQAHKESLDSQPVLGEGLSLRDRVQALLRACPVQCDGGVEGVSVCERMSEGGVASVSVCEGGVESPCSSGYVEPAESDDEYVP